MANRNRTRPLGKLLATVVVYCAAMAVAVVVAADCKVFQLDVPDADTLKLEDGEHVIASTATDKGRLEARVVVRGKKASENQYYIGGKHLRPTPQDRVPKDIGACLGLKKSSELPSATGWLADAARALRDWVEPPVEAALKCTVKCSCNQNTCCCLATCGGGVGVGCAGF